MRYRDHQVRSTDRGTSLEMWLASAEHDIAAHLVLHASASDAAFRAEIRVVNEGAAPAVLRSVAFAVGLGGAGNGGGPAGGWDLLSARSDWLGENRWSREPLSTLVPRLDEYITGHPPRGAFRQGSGGTWSTSAALPYGILESADVGLAWMWQIEHNGAWSWEAGRDSDGPWLAVSGPTDADGAWRKVLVPGESFDAVPVAVAIGSDWEASVAAMTAHRRSARRPHRDNAAMTVVFNDYMNTLNGDPTTAKLLPLVSAAAAAGAEVFCIDAGWYDDSGHWWDTVGEWRASSTRFPGGLGEVVDHIRAEGMVPGLWLEPEVVGVRSPVADRLPDEAFFLSHGQRVVEHDRYHLDLRHPAAWAHLDEVVDRLVREYGVGFFKLDYNIDPATGSDRDTDSTGDALLEHNRAHLAWLDGVLDRHPDLVIENCSSGAMRMDPAMMSRLAMQSTSDQQEFRLYPPIAASAPMTLLPEQAASWAYPQPGMSAEEASFCLVTGLLGRFYLSGFLNVMAPAEVELVADAVATAKRLRSELPSTVPVWPLGLPGWEDDWVSLGLDGPEGTLVAVWRRGGPTETELYLPHLRDHEVEVSTVFPSTLSEWKWTWDAGIGVLSVGAFEPSISARVIRIRSLAPRQGPSPSSDRAPAADGIPEGARP